MMSAGAARILAAEKAAKLKSPRISGAIQALESAVQKSVAAGAFEVALNDHWNDPEVLAPFLAEGYHVRAYNGTHQGGGLCKYYWLSWAPKPKSWFQRVFGDVPDKWIGRKW